MRGMLAVMAVLGLAAWLAAQPGLRSSTVDGPIHQGETVTCDFPASQHMWNRGGSDGSGMCVMSSIEMAALFCGLEQMRGLRDWCAQYPGGAYPAKVDAQLREFCRAKGIDCPPYLQYEGAEVEEVLELADKTGRLAASTYGQSPRYINTTPGRFYNPSGLISHMVCIPRCRGSLGVCLDNNPVGGVSRDRLYEWMPKDELIRRVRLTRGGQGRQVGWVFIWLAPAPPPRPIDERVP